MVLVVNVVNAALVALVLASYMEPDPVVDLLRLGRHVDRGADNRMELLPSSSTSCGRQNQMDLICHGRVGAFRTAVGCKQHFIAPR